MAFQAVPETVEIDRIYTLNGVLVQNVYYAQLSGGYGQADIQALADKIDLVFPTTFVTEHPAEAIYVRTEVRGLADPNDIVAEQGLSNGPGTHPSVALPNNVTFSIKKTSGLTGRTARGRTFWIGVPTNILQAANENLVTGVWAAGVVADVDWIRTQIATVGLWEPVLVSRFLDKVKRPTGVTFPWTGTSNIDLQVDTHRGRMP